jgi:hypothetical protein
VRNCRKIFAFSLSATFVALRPSGLAGSVPGEKHIPLFRMVYWLRNFFQFSPEQNGALRGRSHGAYLTPHGAELKKQTHRMNFAEASL